ncbi:hypothetical protein MP228_003593 [Amoeboaphelidium protococcarum]|nr:hypothetical protein MP228_003593 [Amoeboaphelidium protococcarum]
MLQSVNNVSSGMRMILPSFTRSPTVQAFVYEFNNTQPIGVALLQKSVFAAPIRSDIMHKCVVYQQGQMRGLVKAPYADINDRYSPVGKSRNEMGFSGRKILKQKGNGRARQGTRGSPSRFESGLAFPRKFIDFRIELPNKVQQFGLRSSLSSKYAQDQLRLVDGLESNMASSTFSDHKQLLRESLPLTDGKQSSQHPSLGNSKLLYVLGDAAMVEKASGILPEDYKRLQFKTAQDLTAYDVLCHDYLLLSQEALQILERKLHVY